MKPQMALAALILLGHIAFGGRIVLAQANQEPEISRQVPIFGPGQSEGQAGSGQGAAGGQARSHTAIELGLSIGVLVFGATTMGLEILVMLRLNKYWDTWAIKIVGLTLVITAGLFLIVAGYSQDQVAPMMGILGTVIGYLLGKDEAPGRPSNQAVSTTTT